MTEPLINWLPSAIIMALYLLFVAIIWRSSNWKARGIGAVTCVVGIAYVALCVTGNDAIARVVSWAMWTFSVAVCLTVIRRGGKQRS